MSNLTRLQAVSSSLDIAIDKVNTLPEAGGTEDLEAELTTQDSLISQLGTILDNKASGGSGGDIETCTVTLIGTGPATDMEFCYYNGVSLQKVLIPDFRSDPVVLNDVPKNSIAAFCGSLGRLSGSTEIIYDVNSPVRVLFIAGDSSIESI